MPDPEDFVDAPAGSLRGKLEKQRQGKSKYNAIPEAIKKDPVGTGELLLAAFGAPEFKQGVEGVKGIAAAGRKVVGNKDGYGEIIPKKPTQGGKSATPGNYKPPAPKTAKYDPYPGPNLVEGEKAGSVASKLARFGRPDDPTTQAVQGASVGKEVLNEAKDAGERKARGKVPGASSGALIAQGFDTGAPQQSSSMAGAMSSNVAASTAPAAPGPAQNFQVPRESPLSPGSTSKGGLLAAHGGGSSGSGGSVTAAIAGTQDPLTQALSNEEGTKARATAMIQREMGKLGTLSGSSMIMGKTSGLRALKKGGVITKKQSAAELIYHGHHGEPARA